ncbi:MAG: hypothetical protein HY822_09910 [Acidobacteria bacterium]|nr:hypothetical protein [Acidobacteriota bacterium]
MRRVLRAAYWVAPLLFCFLLYRYASRSWFQQDDFAWLGLRLDIQYGATWLTTIFSPMAQGTIRPLSERLFFLTLESIFGIESVPFRVTVFATQFGSLLLLTWIAGKLTGSRLAGLLAPILWTSSSALGIPLAWTSAYNQILCGFFLLLSFHFLLRFAATGERKWWFWQWVSFLAGFGALEINVVYPALAALYTLCCARRYFRKTLPLFGPSILYAVVHRLLAPQAASGPYAMHFDASMLSTFAQYWHMALGAEHAGLIPPGTGWAPAVTVGVWVLAAALAGFAAWKLIRREWLAAFLPAWFAIVLAPVLPLRNHISEYYLAAPMIGLAVLGAWGLASAWRAAWHWRAVALFCAVVYFSTAAPAARSVSRAQFERSRAVRAMVLGVVRARQIHPQDILLLANLDTQLFYAGIVDSPFRLYGIQDVYLAPGTTARIREFPELGRISDFVLPTPGVRRALAHYRATVYDAGGPRLRNITSAYAQVLDTQKEEVYSSRVEAAKPGYAGVLGPTWHAAEGNSRSMPRRATVTLAGPPSAGLRLYLNGWAPHALMAAGPLRVSVSVNGRPLAPATLHPGPDAFELAFDLPPGLVGAASMEVAVELDRAFRAPDDESEFGLRFGVFSLR